MKSTILTFIIGVIMLLSGCGNTSLTNEKQIADHSPIEKKADQDKPSAASGDGIVGTWKLHLEVFDDNGNRVPDEEEMKKGHTKNYTLQLNTDGSCRMQQMFTGRYEKVTENGREILKVYRKKMEGDEGEPAPNIYEITSVKKDELVLQIIIAGEPSSFWFFKRIK